MDIQKLRHNLTDAMSLKLRKLSSTNGIDFLEVKPLFDEYERKVSEYGNITEEVEWNELTASEYVASIQTTIGNILNSTVM